MNTQQWYYLDGQEQRGPFGIEALRQMLQAGVIKPDTWVARQGEANWTTAATLLSPGPQSFSSAAAKPQNSTASDVGIILVALVLVFICFGIYAANPHLIIAALVVGGTRALWNKFFGNRS